ncbi:MAG: hypothetical protein IPN93_08125 [Bacteroidetes bacterium]|nr:hypothetical protein [Bacteroidota bacterium]
MKKNATYCKSFAIFLGLYLCIFSTITAQKFYTNVALPFSLNGATGSYASPGVVTPNVLSITVSGIGVLTTTNALSIVNVTLTNCGSGSKNMNLVSFRLMAPDGTCVGVYNGGLSTVGTGEHHLNLVSSSACLNNPNVANDAVSGALANVSGNYGFFNTQFGGSPIDITTVFAGKNADGVWKIIFNETTSSEPCVSNAFLGFGNPTITDQANNGEDCTTAINWIGDPICAMTNAKSGSILMPGNISNTATGTSFGTIGSSACQWNQANNNDVWIKFNPTSENVCISISGLDFNLQSLIVKDANEDGDDNPCTANPTVGVNDQRWELISCPNSAIYTTTAGTQLNQQHCFTGVVGETYYMVVDGNGGAESKFYISGVSGLPATDLCPANLADFIPDTVGIINSSCDTSNCTNIPGQLTQPIGLGACPIGSTTQYSINNGSWTSSIPLYNQNGPIQSIKVRCACAADSTELSKESKTVTTNPNPCKSVVLHIDTSICEGQNILIGSNLYTTSGSFIDTLVGVGVCDSIINLSLTVLPRILNNFSVEICEGSSVTVGTNVYTTSGVYSDTLLSSSGCDSVVNLTLTVVPRIINNLSLEICEGSSVTVGTNVYTTSGVYSDTLLSSSGCDSVVNLTLTVVSRIINNLSLEICEGSSVTVGTNVYTTSGVYSDTLLSSSGCDSVVNLTLTVVSRIINNLSLEICEGSSVTVGTNVYTTSGVYSDTLLSSSGCDSVVNLTLTVVSRIINNLSLEICEGSSVTVGTNVYTTSGVYSDTCGGCDSRLFIDIRFIAIRYCRQVVVTQ